ncbi:hypothetical protein [Nocardia sp. NBC_00403]|uniref:hypothetical protein n=1 Tax=Nocardia sp. NBC_00403 TaxID=2975990 RepID=UPI002E204210
MHPLTLHLTRGVAASTLDDARALHNSFTGDGPQPGSEIARALGDLSHNVYTPAKGIEGALAAGPGELLFVDYWADANGMETFFANPFAQEAGDRLYASRDESEWDCAPAGFGFNLPVPFGMAPQFIGMMRAPVRSADETIAAVGKLVSAGLSTARRRGQISHALFIRHADRATQRPAANIRRIRGETYAQPAPATEILALDWWSTLDGLQEHYNDAAVIGSLNDAVAGPPETVVWQQEAGFSEW